MDREQYIADLKEMRDADRDHLHGRTLAGEFAGVRDRQDWSESVAEKTAELKRLGAE